MRTNNTNNTNDCGADPTCFPWCSWTPGKSQNRATFGTGYILIPDWKETFLGFWDGPRGQRGYLFSNTCGPDYFWESDQENCLTPP